MDYIRAEDFLNRSRAAGKLLEHGPINVSDYQRAMAGFSVDVPNSEHANYFPLKKTRLEEAAWKLLQGTVLFVAPLIGFMWSLSVGFYELTVVRVLIALACCGLMVPAIYDIVEGLRAFVGYIADRVGRNTTPPLTMPELEKSHPAMAKYLKETNNQVM
jgi:hypothetical protein